MTKSSLANTVTSGVADYSPSFSCDPSFADVASSDDCFKSYDLSSGSSNRSRGWTKKDTATVEIGAAGLLIFANGGGVAGVQDAINTVNPVATTVVAHANSGSSSSNSGSGKGGNSSTSSSKASKKSNGKSGKKSNSSSSSSGSNAQSDNDSGSDNDPLAQVVSDIVMNSGGASTAAQKDSMQGDSNKAASNKSAEKSAGLAAHSAPFLSKKYCDNISKQTRDKNNKLNDKVGYHYHKAHVSGTFGDGVQYTEFAGDKLRQAAHHVTGPLGLGDSWSAIKDM